MRGPGLARPALKAEGKLAEEVVEESKERHGHSDICCIHSHPPPSSQPCARAADWCTLQALVRRFCEQRTLWTWAVSSVGELDALLSLNAGGERGGASASLMQRQPACAPVAALRAFTV